MNLTEGQKKYHEYLQTDHWKILRDFALFRNWRKNNGILKCDDCEKTGVTGFDVHHNKYPDNRDYENLDNPHYHIVLCRRCHGIVHDKIELSEKEAIDRKEKEELLMNYTMSKFLLSSMNKYSIEMLDTMTDQEIIDLYKKENKLNPHKTNKI